MDFIPSTSITKGWLLKRVYPYIRGKRPNDGQLSLVSQFISYQTKEVKDLLDWEANKYMQCLNSEIDPLPCETIGTIHPDIRMVKASKGKGVLFYSCPVCNGRLFRACGACCFCKTSPVELIKPCDKTLSVYMNLIEYIYPQSVIPAISEVVTAIKGIGDKKEKKEKVSKSELNAILKNIQHYLP